MQHLGRLLDGEAAKESQLYDFSLLRVEGCQSFQRPVERRQVHLPLLGYADGLVERQLGGASPAFCRQMTSGVIHQNVTDGLRGDTEKMRPLLPAHILLIHHPQVGLMD